jgi:protein-disulfide isomerase
VLTRREFNTGVSVIAICAVANLPTAALAQRADMVPSGDLAEPMPLGDMVMGKDDAPVTIIEYASMTCPHCAHFTVETFPKLKERYIDTGKVKYIFREFPLDPLAAGASMLARCGDKDKYFSLIELLFSTQNQWAVQNPIEPLFNVVKQAGYSRETFNACLDTRANENSKKILSAIESTRNRAADKLKVTSTPTFFINGKRVPGALSIEELEKEIAPYLKA